MNRIEDISYYDFQGWPEYKMNLREVLMALGGKVDGDTISFDLKDPLMDVYLFVISGLVLHELLGASTMIQCAKFYPVCQDVIERYIIISIDIIIRG